MWRHGPPWWNQRDEAADGGRLPWLTTLVITVFVQIGSRFAAEGQLAASERGDYETPDESLLAVGSAERTPEDENDSDQDQELAHSYTRIDE